MITQYKALKEVHEIMEKIYESQKGMSPEEVVKDFHESSERFVKEYGLKVKRPQRKLEKV